MLLSDKRKNHVISGSCVFVPRTACGLCFSVDNQVLVGKAVPGLPEGSLLVWDKYFYFCF